MHREPGEYNITSISLATFDAWRKSNTDYKFPIQYSAGRVVVSILSRVHDIAASAITRAIYRQLVVMCPNDPQVEFDTGSPT